MISDNIQSQFNFNSSIVQYTMEQLERKCAYKDHSYLPCCSNIKTTALMKNERKISIMLLSQNVMHSALLVKSIYRISIQKQSEKHCGEREQAEETFRNSCHPPDISRLPHPPPPRSSLHHPAKLFFIGAGVLQNSLCVCDRE